jgi:YidC/Oxa1 family membrane protein insertase
MTSRTWLAIVLCCLVWFVYMRWFAPVPPPPNPTETPTAASSNTGKPPAEAQGTGQGLITTQLAVTESHKIELPKSTIVFSDVGGKIHSIQLKEYTETIQKDSPGIYTIAPALSRDTLGTFFTQSALAPLASAKYEQNVQGNQVRFTAKAGGVSLVKTYQVSEDPYYVSATYELQFPEGAAKDQGYLLVPVGAETVQYDAKTPLTSWEAVMYQNEKAKRHGQPLGDQSRRHFLQEQGADRRVPALPDRPEERPALRQLQGRYFLRSQGLRRAG